MRVDGGRGLALVKTGKKAAARVALKRAEFWAARARKLEG
jgi:hypothetical protein